MPSPEKRTRLRQVGMFLGERKDGELHKIAAKSQKPAFNSVISFTHPAVVERYLESPEASAQSPEAKLVYVLRRPRELAIAPEHP